MRLHPSTVSTFIKRAGKQGIGIPSKRSGAQPKLNARDQRQLVGRQLRLAPRLPMKNHLKLWCDTHIKISMDSFKKYMKDIGFASYKAAAHKPSLADTQKLRKLEWCMDKISWGP
ncbi:Homeodomain-like DNA binding domain-containing transcription factor [Mucor lusitanicus]|uniref:Homeodomain-like DNA binding domain-containing transcription factor n=1 Tax=Mucor lusitanicus CBS 277.49 TaxID=747725 RepID=A0A168IPW3_MUCCL|nr:Homeodomain-like DNA binding domain-containing transcription factor [Mucor lusitanicus CBS 277.49]